MPPIRMHGDGRKAKNPKKTLARLFGYMKPFLPRLIVMVVCIILATAASVASNASLERIIDDFIKPMLSQESPDFDPLIGFLCMMAGIYVAGMVANFFASYVMVPVAQGIQRNIRNSMFSHMQKLPIRYFDTHPVGDLMSRYTSDIDTLRQMISQAIPQCITSVITIVVVFFAMLFTSPILTGIVIVTVFGIIFITAKVAGHSAKFFIGQQRSLGAVNSYVEEMISGQRVVKVFTHEQTCKEAFDELNNNLRKNAFKAGAFTNMPESRKKELTKCQSEKHALFVFLYIFIYSYLHYLSPLSSPLLSRVLGSTRRSFSLSYMNILSLKTSC